MKKYKDMLEPHWEYLRKFYRVAQEIYKEWGLKYHEVIFCLPVINIIAVGGIFTGRNYLGLLEQVSPKEEYILLTKSLKQKGFLNEHDIMFSSCFKGKGYDLSHNGKMVVKYLKNKITGFSI